VGEPRRAPRQGVRIERYSVHPDSGSPGKHRGGCGIVRDVRIIADEGILASRLESVRVELSARGPQGWDQVLAERLSRANDRRMGR
jgi:hypothetical protein